MVYNPDLTQDKERLTAILVADLTSIQLDEIQKKFGLGANLCSPYPVEELFIVDKREWASYSHAEMRRAMSDVKPLLVIDAQTPEDGGIWYIEDFADHEDVEDDQAESTEALFKMRMEIEGIVISYQNYETANTDIRENMEQAGIGFPVTENFTQPVLYRAGFDYVKDRYLAPAYVTATPDEMEETTDPDALNNFYPSPNRAYRLKPEVSRNNGLKCRWTIGGGDAEGITLPDGTVLKFPEGSRSLQVDYDTEITVPKYERPEGSL